MSADKHRARDRRRELIYAASHDWQGIPLSWWERRGQDKVGMHASKRTLRNRDVRRLMREGHLKMHRVAYRGGLILTHPTVPGRPHQRTLSRHYLRVN